MSSSIPKDHEDMAPAVYQSLSRELERRNVRIDQVPEDIHAEAIYSFLDDQPFEVRNADEIYEGWFVSEHWNAWDRGEFVEYYLREIGRIDMQRNRRNLHERAIDCLIQRHIEGREVEDHDIILKGLYFEEQDFESLSEDMPDIRLPWWREVNSRIASDADFLGMDLNEKKVTIVEVKKSDKAFDYVGGEERNRAERQENDLRSEFDNVVADKNFSFELDYECRLSPELNRLNPLPNVYTGELYFADNVERGEEAVEEAIEFLRAFAFETGENGFEPLKPVTKYPATT